jgi:hypothetical protein
VRPRVEIVVMPLTRLASIPWSKSPDAKYVQALSVVEYILVPENHRPLPQSCDKPIISAVQTRNLTCRLLWVSATRRKERRKVVAYGRTSSATNVGADKDSEKRQRVAIEAFAKRAGLDIVDWFYEPGGEWCGPHWGER